MAKKKIKTRLGNDGYDYPYTSTDLVKDNEGKSVTTKFEEVNEQYNTINDSKATKQEVEVERQRINSFTTLAEGSTTGDAELIDGRVGANGVIYDNIGNAIRQQFINLSSKFKTINQLNGHEAIKGKACNEKGIIINSSNYTLIKNIPIQAGVTYYVLPNPRFIVLFDSKGEFISATGDNTNDASNTFIAEQNGFANITLCNENISEYKCFIEGQFIDDVEPYQYTYLDDTVIIKDNGVNKLIMDIIQDRVYKTNNLLTYGTIKNNVYFDNWLHERENDNYSVIKINIEKGEKYTVEPRARFLILTDENGNKSSNSYEDEIFNSITFTAETDGYAYITTYNTDLNEIKCYKEGVSTNVLQLGKYSLNENIIMSNMNTASGNILENKKWAVLGDSFTAGDFNGFTDENGFSGKNSPVIYDTDNQMYKTYPWWIMKRNNMTLQKMYQGGRTLATPADGTFSNCLTYNDMYKTIPEDIDYITIYIGINDSHHNSGLSNIDGEDISGDIPLGTINDTTTATFYGAWNVMLEWLITNRPFAHIGIIVSNGCDSVDYPKATIEVAEKWGIPYLDLNSGYNVPLLHRTIGRDKTCQKAQDIRKTNMIVDKNNWHPNLKTHEYESTFIENFLRSL